MQKNKRFLCTKLIVHTNDVSVFIKARRIRQDTQNLPDEWYDREPLFSSPRRVFDKTDYQLRLWQGYQCQWCQRVHWGKKKKLDRLAFDICTQNRIFSDKSCSLRSFSLRNPVFTLCYVIEKRKKKRIETFGHSSSEKEFVLARKPASLKIFYFSLWILILLVFSQA